MSTGLERHTNEDGAYPKAGGHTLRFVKYVELKSLFSRHFSSKICAQAARSARLLPRHEGVLLQVDRGVKALVAASSWRPVDAEVSAFETRLQLKQWELDLRLVVYLKSSKSWINDTSLLVNYNNLAKEAGTAHAVDCVVVAGRKPIDAERLASFEMYRTSLKDVRIYTFDEVLLKAPRPARLPRPAAVQAQAVGW